MWCSPGWVQEKFNQTYKKYERQNYFICYPAPVPLKISAHSIKQDVNKISWATRCVITKQLVLYKGIQMKMNVLGMNISICEHMMTSSNRKIFRVTCLCEGNPQVIGEFPSQRQVTRSFDVFLDQQTIEQTIETPVIWDAIELIMTSLQYVNVWWWYLRH